MLNCAEQQDDPLLDDRQTSKMLTLKNHGTLAVWRSTGRYALPYVKIGRSIRYKKSDVLAFIEARTVEPTR